MTPIHVAALRIFTRSTTIIWLVWLACAGCGGIISIVRSFSHVIVSVSIKVRVDGVFGCAYE